ncbi:MAG: glycosyltransferases involved in cell wall biogenesis [halophilic archaeon J07HX64]|jgi:Glycosyltransferases involved in cell wall biogenesis|nr:MAG: glycosyltransferases involved in cell wall biogenesis [halophilic archaeon J07HX64]
MSRQEEVCILVPTYNEAETITAVVEGYRERGFDDVLVMDGGSTDNTQDLAAAAGARVREQRGSGKGQAVREAMEYIDRSVVLMVDGDSTYRADEADRMLDPIFTGRAEHVIGNRFANMQSGAMTRLNQVGNRIINRAFRYIHGQNLVDILSGYRAFTRDSFETLSLSAEGFGIETELAVECVSHSIQVEVVPITYEPRPEESETNLRPVRDGGNIILRLYQMAKTNNPLFYFGSVGATSAFVGVMLAGYVVYDYLVSGISHSVLALAAGVALLFGVQLVMFGVLSELIVASNRRQTQQLERIVDRLERVDSDESDLLGDGTGRSDSGAENTGEPEGVVDTDAADRSEGD